jgi:Aspartyl protease
VIRRLFMLGTLAFCVCMLAGPSEASSSVPFTFVDNRMTIQCRIDGAGPFTMIIDTGSPDTVVDPHTAGLLGAQVHGAGTTSGAGNKVVQIGATELTSLSIGSRSFTNVPASVIDLSKIRTKLGFARLDGVIGYAIMKRFAVVVDVDSSTLSFQTAQPSTPSSASATPFIGVIPIVHATIDGIPATVIIDTGDRSSLTLFGPFAKAHGFYGRYPSQHNIITGYGIGGPVRGDVFTLPSFGIFGRQLNAVVTRASRQTGGVFTGGQQAGSVGEGVLKRFNIVYDYPRKQIIAWPNRNFARPDRFVPPPRV